MSRNPFTAGFLDSIADDRRRPRGGMSYVAGTSGEPLRFITVPALLDEAVAAHGGGRAAVFDAEGIEWSWHDLKRLSDDVAAGLLALGVQRGDRVGIWAPNCPQWLLVQFGAARIGAILVNLNPAYRAHELQYALNKSGCNVLVLAAAVRHADYVQTIRSIAPALDRSPAGAPLSLEQLPHLRHLVLIGGREVPPGFTPFAKLASLAGPAQRARLPALTAALDPDDPIDIQFTSGTTGAPKGATLTHFNIVNNARESARVMRLGANDRLCIPVPLYHCFGMVLGVIACVAAGAMMVFPGPVFDAAATVRSVARHRCTALHGVPTMFIAELDLPDLPAHDLSSLRTGIMAGAPCPIEVMRRVMREMHVAQITIAYGMTETSPVSFQTDVDDAVERRVGTVGRVQPHVEAKIIDARGRIVPVGTAGELCTRGYLVMRGYWDDERQTQEAIDAAGWMHSGDLAVIDADGFCRIVGRSKDMLIRGGENVYPREIEEFLFTHPKIRSVQVFGVPDSRYGEEVCAWLVLKPGERATAEEIRDWCQGRIAHYKVPRHVKFVTEFPSTATGKPQKYVMREAMVRELGL